MRKALSLAVPILAVAMTLGCGESRQSSPAIAALTTRAQAPSAELSRAGNALEAKASDRSAAPSAPEVQGGAATHGADAAQQSIASSALATQAAARKLIRTGQLGIEVRDYAGAVKRAEALAERLGGYVADSQTTRGALDRRYGTLTVRVPADQFKATLAELRELGKVLSENITTQDVTKAYTDIETRLRVKHETAARLRDILRDRTARLSDVLEVERELTRVTEESEALEGERRFYDQQIALSSIAVNLSEPDAIVSASAFEPIRAALHNSLQVLSVSIAAMIAVVVFLAPWTLLGWLTWRLIRWLRARRRKLVTPPAA